ncbi:hypothetical protein PISMIDRAFT_655506 [Pisolithus microcarpus 441]|uniref:Uncharacterized protein n=1 Tax=Pisolithus microcarpus 441 TaxID=765257 RepID=A0A0C9ZN13_9AGAM|nr:hypothetical protein PISMIDRAFT_655506 [Pisolithus microcarpus 441]
MVAKRIDVVSHGDVYAVAFMDESQVIGGYRNGYIRRWKIEDGQQQGLTMQGSGECNILAVSVSRDGRWIVTGDDGRKVIAWNAATHEKALEFTEDMCPVFAVDISSDSTRIASVDGKAVQIFSITSGTRLLPLLPHDHVVSVKFSPNGRRFATASFVHGFRIYNTHNGDILFDSEWPVHKARSPVFITSNGKFIAYSAGSSVSLWDCVSHKQIGSIITHSAEIISVALSPSGGCLVCGLQGGKIVIHDLNALPLKYFGHDVGVRLPMQRIADNYYTSSMRTFSSVGQYTLVSFHSYK